MSLQGAQQGRRPIADSMQDKWALQGTLLADIVKRVPYACAVKARLWLRLGLLCYILGEQCSDRWSVSSKKAII